MAEKLTLTDLSVGGSNDVLYYQDVEGTTPATETGHPVLAMKSADGEPLATIRISRKSLYTRTMLFMVPVDQADDLRRWLWAIGRQSEPTVDNPGTALREFSETGDAPATHVGFSDNVTEDERLAIWAANAASKTAAEWAAYGLTPQKVRDLYTNWQRASVERNTADNWTVDDFIIRDVDVGRSMKQMNRVAERVIERQRGRRNDAIGQWATNRLDPKLIEIEVPEQTP